MGDSKAATHVIIGCRLPNGITLEVGYSTTIPGPNNRPGGTLYQVHDDYARIHIRGTREHTRELRRRGMQVPSVANPEPVFTRVSKDYWERWRKEHRRSWFITSGNLFESAEPEDERKAAAMDAQSRGPAILQPMDPSKALNVDENKVEVADFHKDNVAASVAAGKI